MDTDNNNPDESLFVYQVRTDSNQVARLLKEEVYWSAFDNCYMTIDVELLSKGGDFDEYQKIAKENNNKLPQHAKDKIGLE